MPAAARGEIAAIDASPLSQASSDKPHWLDDATVAMREAAPTGPILALADVLASVVSTVVCGEINWFD
jgi:hypothetical protein